MKQQLNRAQKIDRAAAFLSRIEKMERRRAFLNDLVKERIAAHRAALIRRTIAKRMVKHLLARQAAYLAYRAAILDIEKRTEL